MRAMVFQGKGIPLTLQDVSTPSYTDNELLIKVKACGICRTDLHIIDGELNSPSLPLIPGHQVVGEVAAIGQKVTRFHLGDAVGVPWLGSACGVCDYCHHHQENLCDAPVFTGYQKNGGFAEFCVANADFCFPIPKGFAFNQAAPLLCAGLIGYRSLSKVGECKRLGIYGFGAAAHIVTQVAIYQGMEVYAFTQDNDITTQNFAKQLGAVWAGGSSEMPPDLLDGAIIFAPVGSLVPQALKTLKKGGIVVCGGIHMSDIPSFPYHLLWGERRIESVANLTRQDGEDFLKLAQQIPIKTTVTIYPLEKVNEALSDLREGKFTGSAVIQI